MPYLQNFNNQLLQVNNFSLNTLLNENSINNFYIPIFKTLIEKLKKNPEEFNIYINNLTQNIFQILLNPKTFNLKEIKNINKIIFENNYFKPFIFYYILDKLINILDSFTNKEKKNLFLQDIFLIKLKDSQLKIIIEKNPFNAYLYLDKKNLKDLEEILFKNNQLLKKEFLKNKNKVKGYLKFLFINFFKELDFFSQKINQKNISKEQIYPQIIFFYFYQYFLKKAIKENFEEKVNNIFLNKINKFISLLEKNIPNNFYILEESNNNQNNKYILLKFYDEKEKKYYYLISNNIEKNKKIIYQNISFEKIIKFINKKTTQIYDENFNLIPKNKIVINPKTNTIDKQKIKKINIPILEKKYKYFKNIFKKNNNFLIELLFYKNKKENTNIVEIKIEELKEIIKERLIELLLINLNAIEFHFLNNNLKFYNQKKEKNEKSINKEEEIIIDFFNYLNYHSITISTQKIYSPIKKYIKKTEYAFNYYKKKIFASNENKEINIIKIKNQEELKEKLKILIEKFKNEYQKIEQDDLKKILENIYNLLNISIKNINNNKKSNLVNLFFLINILIKSIIFYFNKKFNTNILPASSFFDNEGGKSEEYFFNQIGSFLEYFNDRINNYENNENNFYDFFSFNFSNFLNSHPYCIYTSLKDSLLIDLKRILNAPISLVKSSTSPSLLKEKIEELKNFIEEIEKLKKDYNLSINIEKDFKINYEQLIRKEKILREKVEKEIEIQIPYNTNFLIDESKIDSIFYNSGETEEILAQNNNYFSQIKNHLENLLTLIQINISILNNTDTTKFFNAIYNITTQNFFDNIFLKEKNILRNIDSFFKGFLLLYFKNIEILLKKILPIIEEFLNEEKNIIKKYAKKIEKEKNFKLSKKIEKELNKTTWGEWERKNLITPIKTSHLIDTLLDFLDEEIKLSKNFQEKYNNLLSDFNKELTNFQETLYKDSKFKKIFKILESIITQKYLNKQIDKKTEQINFNILNSSFFYYTINRNKEDNQKINYKIIKNLYYFYTENNIIPFFFSNLININNKKNDFFYRILSSKKLFPYFNTKKQNFLNNEKTNFYMIEDLKENLYQRFVNFVITKHLPDEKLINFLNFEILFNLSKIFNGRNNNTTIPSSPNILINNILNLYISLTNPDEKNTIILENTSYNSYYLTLKKIQINSYFLESYISQSFFNFLYNKTNLNILLSEIDADYNQHYYIVSPAYYYSLFKENFNNLKIDGKKYIPQNFNSLNLKIPKTEIEKVKNIQQIILSYYENFLNFTIQEKIHLYKKDILNNTIKLLIKNKIKKNKFNFSIDEKNSFLSSLQSEEKEEYLQSEKEKYQFLEIFFEKIIFSTLIKNIDEFFLFNQILYPLLLEVKENYDLKEFKKKVKKLYNNIIKNFPDYYKNHLKIHQKLLFLLENKKIITQNDINKFKEEIKEIENQQKKIFLKFYKNIFNKEQQEKYINFNTTDNLYNDSQLQIYEGSLNSLNYFFINFNFNYGNFTLNDEEIIKIFKNSHDYSISIFRELKGNFPELYNNFQKIWNNLYKLNISKEINEEENIKFSNIEIV